MLATSAAAQPALLLSADSLYFPFDTPLVGTNTSTDTLALSFPETGAEVGAQMYGTVRGYGWHFDIEVEDALITSVYLPFTDFGADTFQLHLAPGEQFVFRDFYWDACPFCRGGEWPADTLHLQTASPGGVDTTRVVLSLAGYVSTEPPPEDPIDIRIAPNPTRGPARLSVTSRTTQGAFVSIVDALGRVVHQNRWAGSDLSLDLAPLAAGVYSVTVSLDDGTVATQRLSIVD